MGNLVCNAPDSAHLAAVARDFCPFPDYSPGPLYNVISANSSRLLSEHYASVQASLTPQQQQDFSRTLRSMFGREGKVSYGGVGVVALALAVLFDTVARQVKGEYLSDHEPIPGLFLRQPSGTYGAPVYTVSRHLRLVPHVANNPARMADETERHLREIKHATGTVSDDITTANAMRSNFIAKHMLVHLQTTSDRTVDLNEIKSSNDTHKELSFNLNCDPKEASDRFMAELGSFDNRTKEAFESCEANRRDKTVMESIAFVDWTFHVFRGEPIDEEAILPPRDFDLKANALGKWI